MGANAVHGIILVHLPQYWMELTLDCEDDAAEGMLLEDFPSAIEHEMLHIVIGREVKIPIEVEHLMIMRMTVERDKWVLASCEGEWVGGDDLDATMWHQMRT